MKSKKLCCILLLISGLSSIAQTNNWTVHHSGYTQNFIAQEHCMVASTKPSMGQRKYCNNNNLILESYFGPSNLTNMAVSFNDSTILFGSNDGLTVYDGHHWATYTSSNSILTNNTITAFLKRKNNDIIFSTEKGIYKYSLNGLNLILSSGANDIAELSDESLCIALFTGGLRIINTNTDITYNSSNSEMHNDQIYEIGIDQSDGIYLTNFDGVMIFRNNNWSLQTLVTGSFASSSLMVVNDSSYYVVSHGSLYHGTNNKASLSRVTSLPEHVFNRITTLSNGSLMVLGTGKGAILENNVWNYFENSNIPSNSFSLQESLQGDILLSTKSNPENGNFQISQMRDSVVSTLIEIKNNKSATIKDIVSNDNNLYSNYGKHFLRLSGGIWKKEEHINYANNTYGFPSPLSFYTTSGATPLMIASGNLRKLDNGEWKLAFEFSGYNSANTGITANDSTIYIGGDYVLGAYKNGVWTIYNHENSPLSSYPQIISIHQGNDGLIYIGTLNGALYTFDGKNWITLIPKGRQINSILQTTKGELYIAHYRDGLKKLSNGIWEDIYPNPNLDVNCLLESKNGYLLAGTNKGLIVISNDTINIFDTSNSGIYKDLITNIEEDSIGNIYLTTAHSINGKQIEVAYSVYHGSNDSSAPKVKKTITVGTFIDLNQNGIWDLDEPQLPYQSINLSESESLLTNRLGFGSFRLNQGNYYISYQPTPNWDITSSPTYFIEVNNSDTDTLFFGFTPKGIVNSFESSLSEGFYRCNSTTNSYLNYSNSGNKEESGMISFSLDNHLSLANSIPIYDSISPNEHTFFWEISSLNPEQKGQILLKIEIPGVELIDHDFANSSLIYNNNNTLAADTSGAQMKCSHDPNDKIVFPKGIGDEGFTEIGTELRYTIRFQNTGNDTAFHVIITDTIDYNLDINSFKFISSSHSPEIRYTQNGLIEFRFQDINLPDSTIDNLGSQGYVDFSLNHTPSIYEYTLIKNHASIFFDDNPPIITNETSNTFISDLSIMSTNLPQLVDSEIWLAPNPSTGRTYFYTQINDACFELTFHLYDLTGKMIFESVGVLNPGDSLNLDTIESGTYIYSLDCPEKNLSVRHPFIIH